jgi:hypothetical protein
MVVAIHHAKEQTTGDALHLARWPFQPARAGDTQHYGKIDACLDEIQELYSMYDENKEALGQDIMKRSEDLVAANFWEILQVQELLMEPAVDRRGGYRRHH